MTSRFLTPSRDLPKADQNGFPGVPTRERTPHIATSVSVRRSRLGQARLFPAATRQDSIDYLDVLKMLMPVLSSLWIT
jgi:hypothetical protein